MRSTEQLCCRPERKTVQVFEIFLTVWAHGQANVPAAFAIAQEEGTIEVDHFQSTTGADVSSR